MSNAKCGLLILDAIDQLRKRKARPDFDRISHMLERRHGLKGTAVTEELARLVNEGAVVKVDYKGNTSYRNAAKWVKTKTQFFGSVFSSSDISSIVLDAVSALTFSEDPSQQRSASLQDIEQYLLKRDAQSNLNLATLRAVLEKEVAKRTLHHLPSGEYVAVKRELANSEKPLHDYLRKSANVPTAKRKSIDMPCSKSVKNSFHPGRCDYCLFTVNANRKGKPEELLYCKDCNAKAHPSCMEYTKLLYESYPSPSNWQCPDCKTCLICEETGNSKDDMLTCYICFNGYHTACHSPPVSEKQIGTWFCFDCDTNPKEVEAKKLKLHCASSSSDEDVIFEKHYISTPYKEFLQSIEMYPKQIPVAKDWTIDNVETFFKRIGFEDEASAFREQEIDGLSLLLMKRLDVLTGLGLKLGPAIKIYRHVKNLQSFIVDN